MTTAKTSENISSSLCLPVSFFLEHIYTDRAFPADDAHEGQYDKAIDANTSPPHTEFVSLRCKS